MSSNRVLGDARTTTLLPATLGSIYNESYQDDMVVVPSNADAGTPFCTLNLSGSYSAAVRPADGDVLIVSDPFAVLSAARSLLVVGKSGGQGFQIAAESGPVNSLSLTAPGAQLAFMFSGSANLWTCAPTNLSYNTPPNAHDSFNSAPIGPGPFAAFTSVNITRVRSGVVSVAAFMAGTQSVQGPVQVELLRDATPLLQFNVPSGGVGSFDWAASCEIIDTLPDGLAHSYTLIATGTGNVTVQARNASIAVAELSSPG